MSYYVEHGIHYINVSEYRIARYSYHPVKCLSSAVISFKYAGKHACMSVCVYVWIFMYYYFEGYIHVLRL